MSGFLFFFSYARADLADAQHEDVNYLEQFYLDLEKDIRRLRAFSPNDRIGFRDLHAKGIPLGGDWQPEVSRALAISRTLVCLYSPNFFASENCGKEVQVFLTRRQKAAQRAETPPPVIIPVMWNHPSGVRPLPGVMADFQHSNDIFPKDYNDLGVYNLRRLRKDVEYNKFLMSLAGLIIERGETSPLPELAETPTYKLIPSAFAPTSTERVPLPVDSMPGTLEGATEERAGENTPQEIRAPLIDRRLRNLFVILFVPGNLAILAGSSKGVISAVYGMFGVNGLRLIHSDMSAAISTLLFLAYATGYVALQKRIGVGRWGPFLVRSAGLFLLAALLFGLNLQLSRRQTDFDLVLMPWLRDQEHELTQRLFQRQKTPGGGFAGSDFEDPWTTAQSVAAAASAMAGDPGLAQGYAGNIRQAVSYLESSMTPDDGWPYTPPNGRAVTEVTSWVTLAYVKTLDPALAPVIWSEPALRDAMKRRTLRNIRLILSRQDPSGNWSPALNLPNGARTYSALMALWALLDARNSPALRGQLDKDVDANIRRGIQRLLSNYAEQKAFRANPNPNGMLDRHPGLEALALYVLSKAEGDAARFLSGDPTYIQAKQIFLAENLRNDRKIASNTRLHDTDARFKSDFVLEPSTFLWYPPTLLEASHLRRDPQLTNSQKEAAYETELGLVLRFDEALAEIRQEATYVLDENLLAISELSRTAR